MKTIYFDNAATTKVDDLVIKAMVPYFSKIYGNASEPHSWGQQAKSAIEESRKKVADFLGANASEIIFTSCATESINLAHKGLIEGFRAEGLGERKPHIITTSIEHKAVMDTCKHLEKLGMAEVTYLPVDEYGMIRVEDVKNAIKDNTVLVSIMYVNNEVGTVQPIAEIGKLIAETNNKQSTPLRQGFAGQATNKVYFHTDATQAIQYLNCNVDELGVDLLSLTGHKFYAPKGVGVLYIKKGIRLTRQQDGGGQEMGLRAGTENVPYIVGLGEAIEQSSKFKIQSSKLVAELSNKLIEGVLKISGTSLTGHPTERVPHIASFLIDGVEGEAVLLYLSEKGIAASTGSACTSGTLEPSHVLMAMGVPQESAHGSIRFSLGKDNTEEEVDYVLKVLPGIIKRIRIMAPKLEANDGF